MPNDAITELFTRLSVLERATEMQATAVEKALKLQAQEYSRRLDHLNGEADRLRQMQSTYLPRELYDQAHQRLQAEVEELRAFRDTAAGRYSIIVLFVSALVSVVVGMIVHVWTSAN